MFRQIGPKLKTSSDLLENLLSRHFEGAEYRSDMDILRFFIQTYISTDLHEHLCSNQCECVKHESE